MWSVDRSLSPVETKLSASVSYCSATGTLQDAQLIKLTLLQHHVCVSDSLESGGILRRGGTARPRNTHFYMIALITATSLHGYCHVLLSFQ